MTVSVIFLLAMRLMKNKSELVKFFVSQFRLSLAKLNKLT